MTAEQVIALRENGFSWPEIAAIAPPGYRRHQPRGVKAETFTDAKGVLRYVSNYHRVTRGRLTVPVRGKTSAERP